MKAYLKGITAVLALSATLLMEPAASAKIRMPWQKKKAATEQADTTKKETKYDKLLGKKHVEADGIVKLHLKDGKVYVEYPLSLMGREMLLGSTIKSISDNANGVVGAKSDLLHFMFEKVDSSVNMVRINDGYMANEGGILKSLAASRRGEVLGRYDIKAYNNDSTAVVFEMTDFFLEDNKEMNPFDENSLYAQYERDNSYKRNLSYISEVKSFQDNFSVTSCMSYTYSISAGGRTLLKNEPLTAELTRSVVFLPEKPYRPRMGDYRIGVFFTGRESYSSIYDGERDVYFANRWRLEPSDTAAYRRGELVEPVKPVTYYIDNNFPEWWKPYLREGVSQWNELFEKIGFKNAVVVKDFPTKDEDPEFDPENIKYSCIRYAPIGIKNAMGPSWVDPRTGEILNAAVYVYHDVVELISRWLFVQTAQADPDVRTAHIPHEMLGEALRYVVSHEVGHTLGFMHNMSGSSVIPVDSLRSPSFTKKNGTTTTIMDYARFNYVAQPGDKERGVRMMPPRFGKHDEWLVRWTYTPVFDVQTLEEEGRITSRWISDSLAADPMYRYGKQQVEAAFFDPRTQTEDLGDDVVKATRYGVASLKEVAANFMQWASDDDPDFEIRTSIYNSILNQYLNYAQHVAMNVGGLYKNEVKAGDTMPRFANVPKAHQKECLQYLLSMMDDLDWLEPRSAMDSLSVIGSPALSVKKAVFNLVMMTPVLASLSDGIKTHEYSFQECYAAIFDKVFAPTKAGKALTADQRALQRTYLYTLMDEAGFKRPSSQNNALAPDAVDITSADIFSCSGDAMSLSYFGTLTYDPVSGYEWSPRNIFNMGGARTQADIYQLVQQVRTLLVSRKAGANAVDKAHYELLIKTIDYAL